MRGGSTEDAGSKGRHSFVVPAYGDSPYLADCLRSLRAQTVPSPILLSTSTPHDGTGALADEFGVDLFVHGPNGGIARDWNAALSRASTPWVTIAHQDDVYLPDFTRRTLALADRHPDAALVVTGYGELLGPEGRMRTRSLMLLIKRALLELGFLGRSAVATRSGKRRLLRFGCPIPCPSVSLRLAGAPFRFREDLKVDLDWEAWLRLAAGPGAFAYDRRVLMHHRIHRGSETTAGVRGGVRAAEDRMMFESLWPAPIAAGLSKLYSLAYAEGE